MEGSNNRYEAIDGFMAVQTAVAKNSEKAFKAAARSLRSFKFFVGTCDAALRLLSLSLAFFVLAPAAFRAVPEAARLWSFAVPAALGIPFAALCAGAFLLAVVGPLDRFADSQALVRFVVLVVQSFFTAPLVAILIAHGLDLLSGNARTVDVVGVLASDYPGVVFSFVSLLLLILFLAVVFVFFFFPTPIILAVSNRVIPSSVPWPPNSQDVVVKRVVADSYPVCERWSRAMARQVSRLAHSKANGRSSQLQAVAPALGALAFVALLLQVLPAEQLQGFVDAVNGFFAFTTDDGPSNTVQVLATLTAFGLFFAGVIYSARSYRVLRTLEIVSILCDLRLEECERTDESGSDAGPAPSTNTQSGNRS